MDRPYGAVVGVLQTVLQMIENGDTYLGVATDHVIESGFDLGSVLTFDILASAGQCPVLSLSKVGTDPFFLF